MSGWIFVVPGVASDLSLHCIRRWLCARHCFPERSGVFCDSFKEVSAEVGDFEAGHCEELAEV